MIQSTEDLADLLSDGVRDLTASEAAGSPPRRILDVTPPRVVFTVTTVEGRAYRVTVDEIVL